MMVTRVGVFLCVLVVVIQEISTAPSPGDLHKLYKYTNKSFEKKDKLLDKFFNKQIHFHIQDHHYHDFKPHHAEDGEKKHQGHPNSYSHHHDHRYGHPKDHHHHNNLQKDHIKESTPDATLKPSTTTKKFDQIDTSVTNTENTIHANQLSSLSDSYNLLQKALEASTFVSSTPHPKDIANPEGTPLFRPMPDYNIGEFTNHLLLDSWKST